MGYDRASMIHTLTSHGWQSELMFGRSGPVLFIRGNFDGLIEVPVPVRLDDDHRQAMESVYAVYGQCMEKQGICGSA